MAENTHRPVRGANQSSTPVQIFLDSGSTAGNNNREDIANKLARRLPHYFTYAITNVCGAFGECQLSKKKLRIRVKIFEDGSHKEFNSDFKVLRKLPYEVIIGRRDMVIHRLTLPQNESETDVSRERRVGHPVLQVHTRDGAHISGIADHLSVSAESGTMNQGTVPPARVSGSQRVQFAPQMVDSLEENKGYNPDSPMGQADQRTTELPHTTPKTMLQPTQHEDDNIGEPIRVNMGRNV